jgi:signal transduction histidine kinase
MINSTLKNSNILIIDDQEANVEVLLGLLEMQGYTNIKTSIDPREVISLYRSFVPDLILLDLMMPYVSGFEVMEQLKPLIPEDTYLPILVLTADVTPESKQRALSGGASDFLTKPFDLIEVGLRIRNLLHTSYLQKQLQNQNLILEEKVKERTAELENINIELIAAKEKAEASDKLKGAFINNISHEIRTPLNGILGFSQILTDAGLSKEEKAEYLSMVNESSDRLINTVTNFIDISLLTSKNQEVNRLEFDLEPLLCGVVEKLRDPSRKKGLKISMEIPENADGLKAKTDKDLLEKALFHLLDNAVKFTELGFVKLGFEIKGTNIRFFVEDSGVGISPENMLHIFKGFTQEHASMTRGYEGSGLGLSIASEIVELLGGKIEVNSEKGVGSTCNSQSFGIVDENIPVKKSKPGDKLNVLVAEDDEFNYFYINKILRHEFINLIHVGDGQKAVEICLNNPEIDIVLMDLKMPVMDGFEATRQIKLFRKDLPIIAVTAYSGTEDRKNAMMAGCDEFITKPVKKEVLLKSLSLFGMAIS